jgi:hypothetical protein
MALPCREKMKVMWRCRLFIFVRIRAWQIWRQESSKSIVTARGDILQAIRPKNAPILLDNK